MLKRRRANKKLVDSHFGYKTKCDINPKCKGPIWSYSQGGVMKARCRKHLRRR